LDTLKESTEVLRQTAASRDTVRPLYYLAMAHLIGGDLDGSLQFTHQALRLVGADDPIRRIELCWLSGLLLQRMDFPVYATAFQKQSVAEAHRIPNPQVLVSVLTSLASIHEANHEYEQARKYMAEIKGVSDKTEVPREKQLIDLNLNLLCSRIELGSGKPAEAERCLRKNIDILENLPVTIHD